MRCGDCKSARYCSKYCQQQHFPYNVKYCSAITDLEYIERQKLYKEHSVRQEQIYVKIQNKLVKLIGEKPVVKCILDGVHCEVLWDTGSMITLVDAKWVQKYFPEKKLHSIMDFLQDETLQVRAANSTEISFEGVLLFDFSLKDDLQIITVPFLVTSQDISEPILG